MRGFRIRPSRSLVLTVDRDQTNDLHMSFETIQAEISRLTSTERAKLIDILWESLDEKQVQSIELKWAAESEDRIDAVERGELETLDGLASFRSLKLAI